MLPIQHIATYGMRHVILVGLVWFWCCFCSFKACIADIHNYNIDDIRKLHTIQHELFDKLVINLNINEKSEKMKLIIEKLLLKLVVCHVVVMKVIHTKCDQQ